MADGEMSLRETLEAAAKGAPDPEPGPAPAAAPEAAQSAAVAPEAAAAPDTAAVNDKAPDGPARGPDGKFAPKNPEGQTSAEAPPIEPQSETAPPAEPEPREDETIRIPPSLPAAIKAKFKDLDPDVRDAFVNLESNVQTAKAEWGRKGERLNRYDEIMAPRLEKFQLQGIDEFTAIKTLLAAQDFLERDPLGGISYLARSYGVNLQSLAAPGAPQQVAEGQQAPTADPRMEALLQPLVRQVQTLQQQIQQSHQSTEAEKLATARAEVVEFSSRPENMYFENVKADVAKRLETGAANTLAEAYEQATWASPEIRPLLLKAQSAADARKDAETAARRKAATANQSAGSVTGAPAAGAVPAAGPVGSVRESLLAAREQLGAV